jgi:hypothetical protein
VSGTEIVAITLRTLDLLLVEIEVKEVIDDIEDEKLVIPVVVVMIGRRVTLVAKDPVVSTGAADVVCEGDEDEV